jgi:hypothetical protein
LDSIIAPSEVGDAERERQRGERETERGLRKPEGDLFREVDDRGSNL